MPPIKFRLNLTFEEFQDGHHPPQWPSWLSEWNDFSNFESLCHCDASHQVSVQSDRVWEEMLFEEFQDGHPGGHLGFPNGTILAILNLCVTVMPPIKF